jgi:hypothetical protein
MPTAIGRLIGEIESQGLRVSKVSGRIDLPDANTRVTGSGVALCGPLTGPREGERLIASSPGTHPRMTQEQIDNHARELAMGMRTEVTGHAEDVLRVLVRARTLGWKGWIDKSTFRE